MKTNSNPHDRAAIGLAQVIDDLIIARIAQNLNAGTGPELALSRLRDLIEELKKAL